MRLSEQISDIVFQGVSQREVLFENRKHLFAIAPEFIGLSRKQISAAVVALIQNRNIVRSPVAMHAQDAGEHGKFKPAHKQLSE